MWMMVLLGFDFFHLETGQQTFSVKGQKANILGFAGHRAPAVAPQLCCPNTQQP